MPPRTKNDAQTDELSGDGLGESRAPVDPAPAASPPAAVPTEWDDEFRGQGGSYVVIDGKRVRQD